MSYSFKTREVTVTKPGPSWGIGLHGLPEAVGGYTVSIANSTENPSSHDLREGELIIEVNGTNLVTLGQGSAQYDWFISPQGPAATSQTMKIVLASKEDLEAYAKSQSSDEATVGALLDSHANEHADKPVTKVLSELHPDDPKAKQIKSAIYNRTVPFTTRSPRDGEVQGREYNFVDRWEFESMIAAGKMLEWGEKNGVLYGTQKVENAALTKAKKEGYSRRATMKAAINNGHDAVTLEHLLGRAAAGDHADLEVHSFLDSHSQHPEHGEKAEKVKALVYDMSIPYTTRRRREGEKEGREYHFVSKETFQNMIRHGCFMEYGEKKGNLYGTLKISQKTMTEHKQRKSMQASLESQPKEKEASVSAILGRDVEADVAASRFLASTDPEHPELANIRNQIKVAIYDLTVPLTTRAPRPGEVNGKHYNFVSKESFQLYIENDQMLEWGEKNGVFYGTLKLTEKEVKEAQARPDARRQTYAEIKETQAQQTAETSANNANTEIEETPAQQPPQKRANSIGPYQTVEGDEWHESLV